MAEEKINKKEVLTKFVRDLFVQFSKEEAERKQREEAENARKSQEEAFSRKMQDFANQVLKNSETDEELKEMLNKPFPDALIPELLTYKNPMPLLKKLLADEDLQSSYDKIKNDPSEVQDFLRTRWKAIPDEQPVNEQPQQGAEQRQSPQGVNQAPGRVQQKPGAEMNKVPNLNGVASSSNAKEDWTDSSSVEGFI